MLAEFKKTHLNQIICALNAKANPDYYVFYILDAKYYCPNWTDDSISGQPSVEDVSKQYLYYLAYRDVLERYKVSEVRNYFLMPKRKGEDKIRICKNRHIKTTRSWCR